MKENVIPFAFLNDNMAEYGTRRLTVTFPQHVENTWNIP
jgi:hypothetical protein